MKNIKLFGACAAVVLFSACSNEEDLATAEGLVPEGMHKVTFTINNSNSTDATGKKRVAMGGDGNFTWTAGDEIAVVYKKTRSSSTTRLVKFTKEGEQSEVNANFTAMVDDDTYNNYYPFEVFSGYKAGATKSDYTKVPLEQDNIQDKGNLALTSTSVDMNGLDVHLHGEVSQIASWDPGLFMANLSLDNAALIYVDKSVPFPAPKYDSATRTRSIKVTVWGKTYTINCANANPNGLAFFIQVPEDGMDNPQFKFEGNSSTDTPTYSTDNGKTIERGGRYKLVDPAAVSFGKGSANAKFYGENAGLAPWVQLWEYGPKIAVYDVNTSREKTDQGEGRFGDKYCWEDWDIAYNRWWYWWNMLTKSDYNALMDTWNCSMEWTEINGVHGLKFTGKGDYENNSVFFPAEEVSPGHYKAVYWVGQSQHGWEADTFVIDSEESYPYFSTGNSYGQDMFYARAKYVENN